MIRYAIALAICSLGTLADAAPHATAENRRSAPKIDTALINDIGIERIHVNRFQIKSCGKIVFLLDTHAGRTWILEKGDSDARHHRQWILVPRLDVPKSSPAEIDDNEPDDNPFGSEESMPQQPEKSPLRRPG